MASDTAIADVGQTLVDLLRDRMGAFVTDSDIQLASPAQAPGEHARLTLFLYDVTNNEDFATEERRHGDPTAQTGDLLALDLHYLLTAHPAKGGSNKPTARSKDQHRLLGRAMQILRGDSILRDPDLAGDLAGETLTVSRESVSHDRLLNIWNTFQETPYRPSVAYVVSPVIIDAEHEPADQRVVDTSVVEYTRTGGSGVDE